MPTEGDTGSQLSLIHSKEWTGTDGRRYRREEWSIAGGEIDLAWLPEAPRAADWKPWSRFTLWIFDGEVDPRLGSYGGSVWPPAWPKLFRAVRQQTYQAAVEITDLGLSLRSATLLGSADKLANARLS